MRLSRDGDSDAKLNSKLNGDCLELFCVRWLNILLVMNASGWDVTKKPKASLKFLAMWVDNAAHNGGIMSDRRGSMLSIVQS